MQTEPLVLSLSVEVPPEESPEECVVMVRALAFRGFGAWMKEHCIKHVTLELAKKGVRFQGSDKPDIAEYCLLLTNPAKERHDVQA